MDLELIDRLRADLTAAEYSTASVTALLGVSANGARERGVFAPARRVLTERDTSALATLVRVFLLGEHASASDLDAAFPRLARTGIEQLGIVERSPESSLFRAALSLNPVSLTTSDWWIISDLDDQLRRGPARPDHVMGVGGATRSLITQAPSAIEAVRNAALDLGTGCGIVALYLARELMSAPTIRIVATDISERALEFAAANARLNGLQDRIDFRRGSLFEPVVGEQFDLILSNPPFVITPQDAAVQTTERYEYRDGGMHGDDLVASVVRDAPPHLVPGGTMLCLANWECPWGVDGLDRVRGWLAGSEQIACWVIERDRVDPAQYAETWARDGGARPGSTDFEGLMAGWLDDFASRNVVSIGLGSIRLQRIAGEQSLPALFHLERAGGSFSTDGGSVLQRAFETSVRVAQMSDEQLLETYWLLDPAVAEEREYEPGEESPRAITLTTSHGIERRVTADPLLAAAVGACDGDLTLGQIADALATLLEVDGDAAAAALTTGVRELTWMGMLSPASTG